MKALLHDIGPHFADSPHIKQPSGYGERYEWSKAMSKTHKQILCPTCCLYTLWLPKKPGAKPAPAPGCGCLNCLGIVSAKRPRK